MRCLVVVEGASDKGVVSGIAERLGVPVKVLVARGNNPRKVARLVRAELAREEYDKVVILKDQHRHDEAWVRSKLEEAARSTGHPRVYTVVVRRAVEAWLLAGMGVAGAESIEDPAEHLDHLLMMEGRRYFKTLEAARSLALKIDLDKAVQLSHSLKQFAEALRDP